MKYNWNSHVFSPCFHTIPVTALGWLGRFAGWMAGLVGCDGWLTGWLAGCVGWLAGWQAGWLAGSLPGWLARLLQIIGQFEFPYENYILLK